MTAGTHPVAHRPKPPAHNETSRTWFKHSTAQWTNTEAIMVASLRNEYPQLHVTAVFLYNNNIAAWASAGHAALAPMDKENDRMAWRNYISPPTRLDGGKGWLANSDKLAKYLLEWKN